MRATKYDLGELLKVGMSRTGGKVPGLEILKNLRTDGSKLVPCTTEVTLKVGECIPFTLGTVDYYITSTALYKVGTATPLLSRNFGATLKIVNLIKVVWIQDSAGTVYVDSSGVYLNNPSGAATPLCNSLVSLNGQIIGGGVLDSFNQLDSGYIIWSMIGQDCFELSKDNMAGFFHPNIGVVYDLLPLQDSIIVLGSRGASQMFYAAHTYGFRDLDLPLLKSKSLSASSTNLGVYIAKDGSIIKVDKNGNFENLNYSWIGKDVVSVKYLNGRNWFLFTTLTTTYILDEKGMFGFGYRVWGEHTDKLVVNSDFVQTSWEFRTTFMDLQRAGLKHLFEVSIEDGASTKGEVIAYSEGISKSQGYKKLNDLTGTKYPLAGHTIAVGYRNTVAAPTIERLQIEVGALDRRFGFGKIPFGGQRDVN